MTWNVWSSCLHLPSFGIMGTHHQAILFCVAAFLTQDPSMLGKCCSDWATPSAPWLMSLIFWILKAISKVGRADPVKGSLPSLKVKTPPIQPDQEICLKVHWWNSGARDLCMMMWGMLGVWEESFQSNGTPARPWTGLFHGFFCQLQSWPVSLDPFLLLHNSLCVVTTCYLYVLQPK